MKFTRIATLRKGSKTVEIEKPLHLSKSLETVVNNDEKIHNFEVEINTLKEELKREKVIRHV